MATSVTPKVAAVKKAAPRKAVAAENVVAAAKIARKKVAVPRKTGASSRRVATPAIRPEERHHLIEVAAYYLAERRGFHGASTDEDWLQAEREIDGMIEAGKFAT